MAIYKGKAKKLNDYDLPKVGSTIGVGEDVIHALLEVETRGTGFDKQGRVIMLFEPHKFYRHLSGEKRDRAVSEGLAYPKWGEKKYPSDSYPRLDKATLIDENAALLSCSWGLGQIMGENYEMAGYDSVQDMVAAFADDEANQLQAMIDFIKSARIDDNLKDIQALIDAGKTVTPQDWVPVVQVYNGAGYARNQYHIRAAKALAKWRKIKDTPWSPQMNIATMAALEKLDNLELDNIEGGVEGEIVEEPKPEEPAPPTPPPTEAPKATPEERKDVTPIPAIAPLPSRIPDFLKRIFQVGAGVSTAGLAGPFLFLQNHPGLLVTLVGFFKWIAIGLALGGALYLILHYYERITNARLANELNIARLENYGNKDTKNIDFQGWKKGTDQEPATP